MRLFACWNVANVTSEYRQGLCVVAWLGFMADQARQPHLVLLNVFATVANGAPPPHRPSSPMCMLAHRPNCSGKGVTGKHCKRSGAQLTPPVAYRFGTHWNNSDETNDLRLQSSVDYHAMRKTSKKRTLDMVFGGWAV